jgi:hypothetical protein
VRSFEAGSLLDSVTMLGSAECGSQQSKWLSGATGMDAVASPRDCGSTESTAGFWPKPRPRPCDGVTIRHQYGDETASRGQNPGAAASMLRLPAGRKVTG